MDGIRIEWNGSATFNVYYGNVPINTHTYYGSTPGYECPEREAQQFMRELEKEYGSDPELVSTYLEVNAFNNRR